MSCVITRDGSGAASFGTGTSGATSLFSRSGGNSSGSKSVIFFKSPVLETGPESPGWVEGFRQ